MNTLRDFVEYKLTHSDKTSEAEGYPLTMENCKKNKIMKQLDVYGNTVQGESFLDDSVTLISGYYLINTGEQVSHSKWSTTDYIEVSGYTFTLTNVGASTPAICAYDENKNFIKGARYSTADSTIKRDVKIESDSLIRYLRVSLKNEWASDGSLRNIRLVHNPTPYIPAEIYSVGELVTDESDANYGKYKIPVVCRGKNLCTPCVPVISVNSTYENGVVTQKTADTATNPYFKINAVFLDGTVKMLSTCGVSLGKRAINFTLTDDVQYLIFGLSGSQRDTMIRIQKLPVGTYVFSFKLLNNIQGSYSWCDMQIEYGDVATDYEPYVEPVTTNIFLDEPLRRIGDYADYIDFKNNKVVRRIREQILDGTSITKVNQTSGGVYYGIYHFYNAATDLQTVLKNTHFQVFGGSVKLGGSYITKNGNTLIMTHPNQEFNTVKLWNEWLQEQYDNGTPVKFNYVYYTTIEEPLNLVLPKLNARTSVIEVDTDVAPSNISGKYIKR